MTPAPYQTRRLNDIPLATKFISAVEQVAISDAKNESE